MHPQNTTDQPRGSADGTPAQIQSSSSFNRLCTRLTRQHAPVLPTRPRRSSRRKPSVTVASTTAGRRRSTRLAPDAAVLLNQGQAALPIISCGGGGIFFFWMLGVMKYISMRYDVTKATLCGASAGGLISVLAACEVDLDYAVERAYQLSVEHQLWDRPLGVLGIWGAIIRKWLDDLLPEDAHIRCSNGKVKLVATEVPRLRQVYLQDFHSKQDLLDSMMASAHVPMVLDGRPFTTRSGKLYLDGSLQDFIVWDNSPLLKCDGRAFILDYTQDADLAAERFDFLKLRLYDEILHMIEMGFAYGRKIDENGTLAQYLSSIHRPSTAAAATAQEATAMQQ